MNKAKLMMKPSLAQIELNKIEAGHPHEHINLGAPHPPFCMTSAITGNIGRETRHECRARTTKMAPGSFEDPTQLLRPRRLGHRHQIIQ